MEKALFGSTCSLGGLLNDTLFSECEADQFLGELECPVSKGTAFFPAMETASAADSLGSNLTGEQGGFKSDAVSDVFANAASSAAGISAAPSLAESAPAQAWPQGMTALKPMATSVQPPAANPPANSLALLTQLVSVIQAAQQPQPTFTPLSTALKPSLPAAQPFAPVPQPVRSQPAAAAPSLPSLTAQQQQALQAIMSIGNLGNTVEGKKVRRMLSNRESARRSRHRKQAHVQDLEEKAAKLEEENVALKDSLTHASRLELQAAEERCRLSAEIAALRQKVELLEGGSTTAKESAVKAVGAKRGTSRGSSAAGGASEDSCCDSMPSNRVAAASEEPCCKRCRSIGA